MTRLMNEDVKDAVVSIGADLQKQWEVFATEEYEKYGDSDLVAIVSALPHVRLNHLGYPDDGDRVAFWEKNLAHPTGEAWCTSQSKPVIVRATTKLRQAVADGRVKIVGKVRPDAKSKK